MVIVDVGVSDSSLRAVDRVRRSLSIGVVGVVVADDGVGIVIETVRALDWTLDVDESDTRGTRFVIRTTTSG